MSEIEKSLRELIEIFETCTVTDSRVIPALRRARLALDELAQVKADIQLVLPGTALECSKTSEANAAWLRLTEWSKHDK